MNTLFLGTEHFAEFCWWWTNTIHFPKVSITTKRNKSFLYYFVLQTKIAQDRLVDVAGWFVGRMSCEGCLGSTTTVSSKCFRWLPPAPPRHMKLRSAVIFLSGGIWIIDGDWPLLPAFELSDFFFFFWIFFMLLVCKSFYFILFYILGLSVVRSWLGRRRSKNCEAWGKSVHLHKFGNHCFIILFYFTLCFRSSRSDLPVRALSGSWVGSVLPRSTDGVLNCTSQVLFLVFYVLLEILGPL